MRSLCLMLLVLSVNVNAGKVWLSDLISSKGWDLGYGVVLKLNESYKGKNVPAMERLSLDLNIGDFGGVSVGRAKSDGIELDFFVKKDLGWKQEGRGKKNKGGNYMMPMMIGYKAALMISIMFGIMKMLTVKAIFLAKAALVISLFVLIMKLKEHRPTEVIEVEQHAYPSHVPHYIDKDPGNGYHGLGSGGGGGFGGGGYGHSFGRDAQPSNVYQNVAFAPSAAAAEAEESNVAYASATTYDQLIPVSVSRKGEDMEQRGGNLNYRKVGDTIIGNGRTHSVKKFSSVDI